MGNEICDDGTNDGKGCTADNLGVIPGWDCTHPVGDNMTATGCLPICNDGLLVGPETCDTGISPMQVNWRCNPNCIGNYGGWSCTTTG